ncbi:MAG TPA: hypothetical protein VJV23_05655, partial [Candidatus Polarisedimenticolia bacterium]|nr:hypothetical protein [Candidatus Polarisedimenticolia bacterium]
APPPRPEPPPPPPPPQPAMRRQAAARPEAGGWRPEAAPPPRDEMPDERSRPWFLLGGAAAVGFAALFLILMAQNPGESGEAAPMPADPTLADGSLPPVRPLPVPDAVSPSGSVEADQPDGDDPPDKADLRPEGQASDRPGSAAAPRSPAPAPPAPAVATPGPSRMLDRTVDDEESGRESLLSGDYRAAARHFGRHVAARSGDYTIQLLTACQDDTVRRAVESGRGSANLFILSTSFEGRSCYRVYWGRYPSQKRAQEALHREVPASFRSDRSQPRITRLAGS